MTPDRSDTNALVAHMAEMSNWGRWGTDDELGALNLLTPEKVRSAASLIRDGSRFSLSRVIEFAPRPAQAEAPVPPVHFMQSSGEAGAQEEVGSAHDWVGLPIHGHYLTHVDALSHF